MEAENVHQGHAKSSRVVFTFLFFILKTVLMLMLAAPVIQVLESGVRFRGNYWSLWKNVYSQTRWRVVSSNCL